MDGQPGPAGIVGAIGSGHRIHLSYRPGDVDDTAGRIYDRLAARYGRERIARDLSTDLPTAPTRQPEDMRALVLVVGPRWLNGIGSADDRQRRMVAAALGRQLPLIPVLAEGATMPAREQLPEEIGLLALFNAAPARLDPDFDADMQRLQTTIEQSVPEFAIPAPMTPMPAAANVPASKKRRVGCSLWGVLATMAIVPALLFLLVAILFTLTGTNAPSPQALAATPPATATFLPTPSAAGSYFSPLTDGAPEWRTSDVCHPEADGLHIANSDNGCMAPDGAAASNGVLSVTARQLSGPTNVPYGIFFRAPIIGGEYYAFLIATNGEWTVIKQVGATPSTVMPWRAAAAIHTGLGATNALAVRFKGAQFTFFVNGQQVGAASGAANEDGLNDSNGLFGHTSIEVVFTDYRLKPVS